MPSDGNHPFKTAGASAYVCFVTRIASERRATEAVRTFTLWQALYNPKVLLLALNYL